MKKALLILSIICISFQCGLAQTIQKKIDSLKQLLEKEKEDTNKVNTLSYLSDQFSVNHDYETERKYANEALTLSQSLRLEGKQGWAKGEAGSHLRIGFTYYWQGNIAEALKNYSTALKIYKEIGDSAQMASVYNGIGLIYDWQGNYPEALKNYFNALKIYEEIGDKKEIGGGYMQIGNNYATSSNYQEALKNYLAENKKIQEQIAEQQKIIRNGFIGAFVVALIIAILFINRFRLKQKSESALEEKNKIITSQKEKVETQSAELSQTLKELKQSQLQMVQSEKMASLGQLIAGVAHEINNPINFVSGNITPLKRDIDEIMILLEIYSSLDNSNFTMKLQEILKYRDSIDLNFTIKEIRSLIKGIEDGSNRTAAIVKGLRYFSRLDDEEMKETNIHEGIESTLLLLNNRLTENQIEVIKSFSNIPDIKCYPGQLNQVFMNMISNAIDAIDSKGKILITTSSEDSDIRISIRDTGKGITEKVKQKIFDPFFTTKEVGKGTGLGLSISYGIVEKHHGEIEVISEEGEGTEFIITLPVNQQK